MTNTTKPTENVNPHEQCLGPRREKELVEAAREVLDRWEAGDREAVGEDGAKRSRGNLAGAIRRLDTALSAYRNRKPRRA